MLDLSLSRTRCSLELNQTERQFFYENSFAFCFVLSLTSLWVTFVKSILVTPMLLNAPYESII